MRDKIKAIPTKYKGITFRSKMESLFAKWCDENRQKWIYEPEGLTNGKDCYLPDFYLPDSKMIVEIKPVFFVEETYKLDMLINCESFDKLGLAIIEMVPGLHVIKYAAPNEYGDLGRYWEDKKHNGIFSGLCQKCGAFNICGDGSWHCKGCGFYDGDCTISNEYN